MGKIRILLPLNVDIRISRIRSSTLMETLIAMLLVMLSFGLTIMVFINIMQSNDNHRRFKAKLILEETAIKTKNENIYFDEVINDELFTVKKTIQPYKNNTALQLFELSAFDKEGKLLAQRKEVIPVR